MRFISFTQFTKKGDLMEWETYEWTTIDGKHLRVRFRRIIDEKGRSWMEVSDAFTVEEIKDGM